MANTSYNLVQPAAPGGTAGLQAGLNSIQQQLTSYNPATGKYGTPAPAGPTAVYSPVGNTYDASTPGQPQWNGSSWVSSTTGQPFSGTYFGQTYTGGQTAQQLANNPNESYQAVNITKSPAIASATANLQGSFNSGLNLQNNDFSDFLNAANLATGAATSSFNNDLNTAYNTGPLTNTLNSLNSNYASGANALGANFNNTSNNLNTQYSNTLSNLAGQENSDVAQANALLPQYNQAITNIGNLEEQGLQKDVSRYAASSGTPTGLGSNEEQTLALGIGQEQVPLQEAEIGQQYNLLQNLDLPIQQQQAQAQIGQIQNFSEPLAQTQYGQGIQNLNTQYGQQYNTATGLQQLALQIAGKPIQEATQYLQAMGVPTQVQQQLLSGNVGNLQGLSNLYSGSQYQGLQNLLGANVASPSGAGFSAPGYPSSGNTNYGFNSGGAGGYSMVSPGGVGANGLPTNTQMGLPGYTPQGTGTFNGNWTPYPTSLTSAGSAQPVVYGYNSNPAAMSLMASTNGGTANPYSLDDYYANLASPGTNYNYSQ